MLALPLALPKMRALAAGLKNGNYQCTSTYASSKPEQHRSDGPCSSKTSQQCSGCKPTSIAHKASLMLQCCWFVTMRMLPTCHWRARRNREPIRVQPPHTTLQLLTLTVKEAQAHTLSTCAAQSSGASTSVHYGHSHKQLGSTCPQPCAARQQPCTPCPAVLAPTLASSACSAPPPPTPIPPPVSCPQEPAEPQAGGTLSVCLSGPPAAPTFHSSRP